MASRDWESLGENIRDIVEDAVKSQDYTKLSQSITSVVNSAVDSVSSGINNVVNNSTITSSSGPSRETFDSRRGNSNYVNRTAQFQEQKRLNNQKKNEMIVKDNKTLFEGMTKYQVSGLMGMAVGFPMAGIMGLSTIAVLATELLTAETVIGAAFVGMISLGFGVMGVLGKKKYSMAQRFQTYIRALRGKGYINLDQLALDTSNELSIVKKDVETMIRKAWFRQGHLDKTKSCLMVTDKLYDEYKQNEQQAEILQLENKAKQEAEDKENQENSAVREVLRNGLEYLDKIKKCNAMIPGEEMTKKISKIEIIVARIFDRVEKHPENISDIRKMMEYYLPTTVKLLEAYAELDMQPVKGDNIIKSKAEIENSLDTLNLAFEKLLDELFKDTAWDVSTDISVLNTLLAQDGLTKKDFED